MATVKENQPVKMESAWKETCKGAAMIKTVVNTIWMSGRECKVCQE